MRTELIGCMVAVLLGLFVGMATRPDRPDKLTGQEEARREMASVLVPDSIPRW